MAVSRWLSLVVYSLMVFELELVHCIVCLMLACRGLGLMRVCSMAFFQRCLNDCF